MAPWHQGTLSKSGLWSVQKLRTKEFAAPFPRNLGLGLNFVCLVTNMGQGLWRNASPTACL